MWLRVAPDVLAERVRSGTHRPLLADDPAGTLARLAAEREPLYRETAHEIVDVGCAVAVRRRRSCARVDGRSSMKPIVVPVGLGDRAYDVVVGEGVRHHLAEHIPAESKRVGDRHPARDRCRGRSWA